MRTTGVTSLASSETRFGRGRRGLTLMEVVVAMGILLMSLAAIAPLIQVGGQRALDAQLQELALRRCESKLGEVLAGSESLGGESDGTFPDDPDGIWRYTIQASQGEVTNLWSVEVTVYRQLEGRKIEVSLSQMIMDPMYRASAVNTGLPPLQGTASTTTSSSSSTSGSTSGTTGGMSP